MFTIWEKETKIVEVRNVFDALTHMKDCKIYGEVKDGGNTIVSYSKNGIDWADGKSPFTNLTTLEAAYLIGLSVVRVNQLCNKGRLTASKFGKSWAIPLGELKKFATQKRLSGVGFNQQIRNKEEIK